mmetsp:Transcript_26898/g.42213  ORF Transcript_26898/g.42213 Transcript_26898/m.42213 type:complete len:213 (-) Transcript_26898:209-847(-)
MPWLYHRILVGVRHIKGVLVFLLVDVPVHAHGHHGEEEAGHGPAVGLRGEVPHGLAHHLQRPVPVHDLVHVALAFNDAPQSSFGLGKDALDAHDGAGDDAAGLHQAVEPHGLEGPVPQGCPLLGVRHVPRQGLRGRELEALPALLVQVQVLEGFVGVQLHELREDGAALRHGQVHGHVGDGPRDQGAHRLVLAPPSVKVVLDVCVWRIRQCL